ncbi:MAG: OadG family protein [Candidatus Delongbacteria bacterium]|nr:OadG family protein [Candidatus Delongbacteria bacterium]
MIKNIYILIFIFLVTTVFPAEKVTKDSILNSYTDDEFKQAVIQVLEKGNVSNRALFIKELEIVRLDDVEEEEKLYGLDNINKKNANGMDGWDVAISGIIVVFIGLMTIMLVLYLFNYMFKPKTAKKARPVAKKIIEEVPEDIIIAIATAVELYTRLYSTEKLKDLSFKTTESESWKIKDKFVQGSS